MTIGKRERVELYLKEVEHFEMVDRILEGIIRHSTDPFLKEKAEKLFDLFGDFCDNECVLIPDNPDDTEVWYGHAMHEIKAI